MLKLFGQCGLGVLGQLCGVELDQRSGRDCEFDQYGLVGAEYVYTNVAEDLVDGRNDVPAS